MPWIILLLVLATAATGFGWWHEHTGREADERLADAAAAVARAEKRRIEDEQDKIVEDISNAWNDQLPGIRQAAVDQYRRRYGNAARLCPPAGRVLYRPGSLGPLPGQAEDPEGIDAAERERMAAGSPTACEPPAEFIAVCAKDAGLRRLTREWATKVGLKADD